MLLHARKVPWLERAYAHYGRRLLGNAFARVWIGGAAWPDVDGPTIAFLNHSAWWDPVLTLFLSHGLFRRDGYGIMEGAQLERYPFFRRIGCFGATGDSLEDTRAVTEYAAQVLRGGRRRTLWLFPQGALLPARTPLAFRSGLARIARATPGALLVPIAVRYELRREQRPEIFVRVGEAVPVDAQASTSPVVHGPARAAERSFALGRRLELRLRQELALLDEALTHPDDPAGYTVALDGRASLSRLYDRTFGRWSDGRGRKEGVR